MTIRFGMIGSLSGPLLKRNHAPADKSLDCRPRNEPSNRIAIASFFRLIASERRPKPAQSHGRQFHFAGSPLMPRRSIDKEPTDLQRRVLAAMVRYIRLEWRPPTNAWLREELGYASSRSIVEHLQLLDKKGLVKYGRGGMVPTDSGYAALAMLSPAQVERAAAEMVSNEVGKAVAAEVKRHLAAAAKVDRSND